MYRLIYLISFVITIIFCSVWQNVVLVKTGHDIYEKEIFLNELKFKNRMLEIRVANLKSLERIEEISKKELGLCRAEEYRIVYLKEAVINNNFDSIKKDILPKSTIITKLFGRFTSIAEAKTVEK